MDQNMIIKCIALDLDHTTLDRFGRLSPGNRIALEQVIAQGVQIVVASGRSYGSLPEEIRTFPGIQYAITSNGAAVYDLTSGEAVHRWVMTRQSVLTIWQRVQGTDLAQAVFVGGRAYAPVWYLDHLERYGVEGMAKEYVTQTCRRVEDWPAFIHEHAGQMDSYDVFEQNPDRRKVLFDDLRSIPDLYFTSSDDHMLEMSHRDTGKGNSLRWLLERLHLQAEHCAAFGDGENDVDLLKAVGWPVAMENAHPRCKAVARYLAPDHDRDGVAHALHHYFKLT